MLVVALALAALTQRSDTTGLKSAVRQAVAEAVRSARAQSPELARSSRVFVDVATFQRAVGLGRIGASEWSDVAPSAVAGGENRTAAEVWRCDPRGDVHLCSVPGAGEMLVRADTAIVGAQSLLIEVAVNWGTVQGNRRVGARLFYNVVFRRVGQTYQLESVSRAFPTMKPVNVDSLEKSRGSGGQTQ